MPFEIARGGARRIAVIGGGISGLGAADMLADRHQVVLFEAENRLGGHARTVLAGRSGTQPVDTGFIVFNRVNYPHLVSLFERLGVPVAASDMSFGASLRGGWLEYGLRDLWALTAQRRNLARPAFLRMLRDVLRFNAHAEATAAPGMTIGDLLAALGTGTWFRDHYLLPLSGAIWSTPPARILDFPAQALIRFFRNHNLLQTSGQHQWYTVKGGSVEYVRRLRLSLERRGVDIRLGAPVAEVRRPGGRAEVRAKGGLPEGFDMVVMATHADDTLALLADAGRRETAALTDIRYQPNRAVLHADPSLMPRRSAVWSAWNYTEGPQGRGARIDLTYWMNALQPIPKDDPLFVTLNANRTIRDELIHDEVIFRHPVYDGAAMRAQEKVRAFNGTRNTWFCGAWMKNGFHEDGLASAVDVARAIEAETSLPVAAE